MSLTTLHSCASPAGEKSRGIEPTGGKFAPVVVGWGVTVDDKGADNVTCVVLRSDVESTIDGASDDAAPA